MCVLFTLPASACQDAEGDPVAVAVAPETHGAILFSSDLSSVPHLLSAEGLETRASAAAEAWWESWTLSKPEGERLRSRIYPSTVDVLLPVLGADGVLELLTQQGETLGAVETAMSLIASQAIGEALDEARSLHDDALFQAERGDTEGALLLALRSADVLWGIRPQQVAMDLLDKASRALGRNGLGESYTEEELTRIRRLTNGARESLEQGDYPRAIRRAYYACQLLGANSS
jgi:hypothetical protein